jgi:hypothetical protein
MYRLKAGQEAFQLVDGQLAGIRFTREWAYTEAEIPAGMRGKFEIIPGTEAVAAPQKAACVETEKPADTQKRGK